MMGSIYMCVNQITGKVLYIGQTVDSTERWKIHQRRLVRGKHPNKELQAEFAAYGNAFVWRRIEFCAVENLSARECYWIKAHSPLYNKIEPPKKDKSDQPKGHG